MRGVSTARFGELEVEEEKGEVGRIDEDCASVQRGEKEGGKQEKEPSIDHEGSVAAGPALAQPGQLHRQSGQPTHPLF